MMASLDLTSQTQPTPARITHGVDMRDTESDPRWDWLGLACKTRMMATKYC